MSASLSRSELRQLAAGAGLVIVGVTNAEPFHDLVEFLREHVARGHLAGMNWFTVERAEQSCDPRTLHADARSIVSVGVPFWSGPAEPPADGVLRGRIARYAWGRDYHGTLKRRMRHLVAALESAIGRALDVRMLVDTARIVDRAVAARAGAGWYGKNSMIIVPGCGSWVMLGEIILDVDLPLDVPLNKNCGSCEICIERCPTGAIIAPYRIHSPSCISALTIEERGSIPLDMRPRMGAWVFGCDVCQDVCPYTGAARPVADSDFAPRSLENAFPSLAWLATMTEREFRRVYSGTAVTRAKRAGLARNAAIALGNSIDPRAEPILRSMLRHHDEPLARGHAAWALARYDSFDARRALRRAFRTEPSEYVRDEIIAALAA